MLGIFYYNSKNYLSLKSALDLMEKLMDFSNSLKKNDRILI